MDLPMLSTEFHTGLCFDAHHLLGAHPAPEQGSDVWLFRLWAPSAQRVQVFGDFNSWSGQDLARDAAGVWSGYVTGAHQGQFYKPTPTVFTRNSGPAVPACCGACQHTNFRTKTGSPAAAPAMTSR